MTEAHYRTARAMLADLAARKISARELLDLHLARNDALHAKLNAVIATDIACAVKSALAIDDARAKGTALGPLAGLPMTIKDGYDVAGLPAASGNPAYADRAKDCADAELVARARGAGVVIWGKTNVPFMLADFQSYNAIYGTTNNPWDGTRTPGGSSGGAAAALAAGITPLEIGSDIGGSLRHPANFCGVYSLKPTWGVLPMRGHVPPPPGIDAELDLGVGGPMARNAGDLKLLWDVLNKCAPAEPRAAKSGRVALWDEEPGWPLASAVKERVIAAGGAFERAGLRVERVKPKFDMQQMLDTYLDLLTPIIASGFPPSLIDAMEKSREADLAAVCEGHDENGQARFRLRATARDADIAAAHRTRQAQKDSLDAFFAEGWDAILMPVSPTAAFTHRQEGAMNDRTLELDGRSIRYSHMLDWIALATALHNPALVAPAGLSEDGLPVGVQLVGPWHGEDRLLDLAAALGESFPFQAPPL